MEDYDKHQMKNEDQSSDPWVAVQQYIEMAKRQDEYDQKDQFHKLED